MEQTKKITLATIKSFIKKHFDNKELYILITSSFSGMTDCVESVADVWHQASYDNKNEKHSLGIHGLWLVGSSRDYFEPYENEEYKGYKISNCCGSLKLAIKKEREVKL